MSYKLIATDPFKRKLKQLAKKYKSLKDDLTPLFESLAENPQQGVSLGNHCYKIRLVVSSKSKGKSGGVRLITFVRIKR